MPREGSQGHFPLDYSGGNGTFSGVCLHPNPGDLVPETAATGEQDIQFWAAGEALKSPSQASGQGPGWGCGKGVTALRSGE